MPSRTDYNEAVQAVTMPDRIKALAIDERGYPVPWFVAWINGRPDFRIADTDKLTRAIRSSLCWVCGQPLGRFKALVIGPMCVVNRTSAEPPSHLECARFSVQACPFMSKPRMRRNEADLGEMREKETIVMPAGEMIRRNPGVTCIWIATHPPTPMRVADGVLFHITGKPDDMEFWCEGRRATLDEIDSSIDTGLPILQKMAREEGMRAMAALDKAVLQARELIAGFVR